MADYRLGENLRIPSGIRVTSWRRDPSGPATFEQAVEAQFAELQGLLIAKHHNYGPDNIMGSPGSPMTGLRVRMWDKLARINHMLDNNVPDKVGEPLMETFGDLANYGVIARLVLLDQFRLPLESA